MPHVRGAADAREAVSALRFPPAGHRGVFTKGVAAEYGAHGYADVAGVLAAINAGIVCNVIIEDVEGVDNIDEIVAVEGLDFLTLGPNDLAGSFGVPGQTDHPVVREAGDRVIAACRNAKVPVHTTSAWAPKSREELEAAGIRLLTSASDAMNLMAGMRLDARASRREPGQ